MRKILLAIMLVVLIMGCAPQTAAPTEPTPEVKEVVPEPKDEPAPAQTTVVEKAGQPAPSTPTDDSTVIVEKQPETITPESGDVPAAPSTVKEETVSSEISPQVKDLLERADRKVKSYSYTLAPPPDQLARDKWMVRGSKVRVELFDDNYVEPDTYFDNIFIDTSAKTAVGVCLSQRTTRCAEAGQEFEVAYDDVMVKTPYQWLKSVSGTPKIISTELLYDRKMDVIEYKSGGKTIRQWIDQFSGLPVRVQVGEDKNSRTEFRYLAINSVTEEEIAKP